MVTLNNFISNINKQNGNVNRFQLAKDMLKGGIDIGQAVVNVIATTGIAGFKFHLPESERINMESEITDHYSDTNTAIQDHIARKPVTITLSGMHGEYFYSVNEIEDMLSNITPALSLVTQFVPKLSAATMQIKQSWSNYQQSLNTGAGIRATTNINPAKTLAQNTSLLSKANLLWNSFNQIDLFKIAQDLYKIKSAQTRAFLFFEALWKSNAVFSVETTWKRYDNMLIQKLSPERDNNADITNFTVTFKQMNFAQTQFESLNNAAGRTRQQIQKAISKGIDKGEQKEAV